MSSPGVGPCVPYITQLDLCCVVSGAFPDKCLVDEKPITTQKINEVMQAASELMYAATGRQFGLCEVTIRPCKTQCGPCDLPYFDNWGSFGYGFGYAFIPVFQDGIWTNINPCSCAGNACGCKALSEITLPSPVSSVTQVKVNGVILPSTEYRVDDFRTLVRLNGNSWPKCQNLTLDDTHDDTFSVKVIYGKEVPFLVKQGTAELACQLLKACVGSSGCQLPQRISSMTRQGITVGFLDTMAFLDKGRTGIYLVDLPINTFNPRRLQKNASVYSIDSSPKFRRVDT